MTTYLVTFTETVEVEAENAAVAIADARSGKIVRVAQSNRVKSVEELVYQPPLVVTIPIAEWGERRNWGGQE